MQRGTGCAAGPRHEKREIRQLLCLSADVAVLEHIGVLVLLGITWFILVNPYLREPILRLLGAVLRLALRTAGFICTGLADALILLVDALRRQMQVIRARQLGKSQLPRLPRQ